MAGNRGEEVISKTVRGTLSLAKSALSKHSGVAKW